MSDTGGYFKSEKTKREVLDQNNDITKKQCFHPYSPIWLAVIDRWIDHFINLREIPDANF